MPPRSQFRQCQVDAGQRRRTQKDPSEAVYTDFLAKTTILLSEIDPCSGFPDSPSGLSVTMRSPVKPFRPHKLLPSSHWQTLGGVFFPGKIPSYGSVIRMIDLFDGDRLAIHDDRPAGWSQGDRIVILLHGFCGTHQSSYMRRLAYKLFVRGIRAVRIDFRGFGESALVSRSHLYGGCSHDVDSVVRTLHEESPASNISIVGFSIGGNILLKLLGEWGSGTPDFVDSAVAASPPVDLVYASWNIRRRGNQMYEANFIKQLKRSMTRRRRIVPGLLDNGLNPLPRRLRDWDEHLIAPVWGFKNAQDYYEKCSAGPLLRNVSVPTLILWAHDDSIVPVDSYHPFTLSSQIEVLETRYGGHLGFVGAKSDDPDRYWMDWRILDWIAAHEQTVGHSSEELQSLSKPRLSRQDAGTAVKSLAHAGR